MCRNRKIAHDEERTQRAQRKSQRTQFTGLKIRDERKQRLHLMGTNMGIDDLIMAISPEAARINSISRKIVGCGLRVHSRLGPGLLESVYEACLAYELNKVGLEVRTQVPLGLKYDELTFEVGYRADMLVEGQVLVELKACDVILPVHRAQLLSYLRLSDLRLGMLINFHALRLKDGIVRIVNKL